jgi:hypothetical protein
MRELHRKNMDKMRDALDDIKDGTVRNEGDQSLEVETLQNNATRLGKATKNGVGYSSLNISTPAQHHVQEDSKSHFEFDDTLTKKGILSPRVRGLMKKNEDLEREMREIMSLSPRSGSSPRSPVSSKEALSPTTPSSARYTTPRNCTDGGAPYLTSNYDQTLHTITEQN